MKDVLLDFYDGKNTGVAAYKDKNENILIHNLPFSLENSICGFGIKSGFGNGNYVHYTNENLWCKPNIINTPFEGINFVPEKRTVGELLINKNAIKSIIYFINSK